MYIYVLLFDNYLLFREQTKRALFGSQQFDLSTNQRAGYVPPNVIGPASQVGRPMRFEDDRIEATKPPLRNAIRKIVKLILTKASIIINDHRIS